MIKNRNTRHLKIAIATLALATLGFTGAHAQADAADEMVNPTDKVLVGYWHNWESTGKDGYKYGTSADFDLSQTQDGYNVINVSFMKTPQGSTLPTFKPYNKTDAEFRADSTQKANLY